MRKLLRRWLGMDDLEKQKQQTEEKIWELQEQLSLLAKQYHGHLEIEKQSEQEWSFKNYLANQVQ